jgi:hypothetical protein
MEGSSMSGFCGTFKKIRIFANYYKFDLSYNTYYDVNPVLFWSGFNESYDETIANNELNVNKAGFHNGSPITNWMSTPS